MITEQDIIFVICSYALGCCTAGYYLTQWRTGSDIRLLGSGSVGASNVGRTLGTSGFVVTFLIDFAKGAIVVLAAHKLQLSSTLTAACLIAVVAGHIWPIQLGFRGGKGIATSFGALCIYNYESVVVLLVLFILSYLVSRRFVLSGMVGYLLFSLVLLLLGTRHVEVAAISLVALAVILAHRQNIREDIAAIRRRATAPTGNEGASLESNSE